MRLIVCSSTRLPCVSARGGGVWEAALQRLPDEGVLRCPAVSSADAWLDEFLPAVRSSSRKRCSRSVQAAALLEMSAALRGGRRKSAYRRLGWRPGRIRHGRSTPKTCGSGSVVEITQKPAPAGRERGPSSWEASTRRHRRRDGRRGCPARDEGGGEQGSRAEAEAADEAKAAEPAAEAKEALPPEGAAEDKPAADAPAPAPGEEPEELDARTERKLHRAAKAVSGRGGRSGRRSRS